jgi:hypothetical protein
VYLVNTPLTCLPVAIANNARFTPNLCTLAPGAVIKATASMAHVLTYGSLAGDYTGFLSDATIQGGTIDGSFLATDCVYVPFFNNSIRQNQSTKNCTRGAKLGDVAAPATSAGMTDIGNFHQRDVTYIPVASVSSSATAPVVTTTYPHGFTTGRIVNFTSVGSAVTAAGSGYGASATGTLTWAGTGCTTNPVMTAVTNAGGQITAAYLANTPVCTTFPSTANWTPSAGLSAGTGVIINIGPFELMYGSNGNSMWWQITVTGANTFTLNNGNSTTWPAFVSANVSQTMPSNAIDQPVFGVTRGTTTTITAPAYAVTNGESIFIADLGMTDFTGTGNCIDGVFTVSSVTNFTNTQTFTIPFNSSTCNAYASGGTVIPAPNWTGSTNSNPTVEAFVYNDNASDSQFYSDYPYGIRAAIVNNPNSSGYGGKIQLHAYDYPENGQLLTSFYGGGNNSFLGLQTDCPARFSVWIFQNGIHNTMDASTMNCSGFVNLPNNIASYVRLDPYASMTVLGGKIQGGNTTQQVLQPVSSPFAPLGQFGPIRYYSQLGTMSSYVQYNVADSIGVNSSGNLFVTNNSGSANLQAMSTLFGGSIGQLGVCDVSTSSNGLNMASGTPPQISLTTYNYLTGSCGYTQTELLFYANRTKSVQPIVLAGPYSAAGTPIPTCNATLGGATAYVTDATARATTYTSGGGVTDSVFCNGTNWLTQ